MQLLVQECSGGDAGILKMYASIRNIFLLVYSKDTSFSPSWMVPVSISSHIYFDYTFTIPNISVASPHGAYTLQELF